MSSRRARRPSGSPPATAASRSSRPRAARCRSWSRPARCPPSCSSRAAPALTPMQVIPRALGEAPQHAQVRVRGAAVVEHDRRVGEQAADEEVPHHPAGRGEPEHAVAGRAGRGAGASSAARAGSRRGPGRSPSAGRSCPTSRGPTAGGRTAPARSVSSAPSPRAEQLVPGEHRELRRRRRRLVAVRRRGRAARRCARRVGISARMPPHDRGAVEVLAAVAVAVDREQHLRLDLGEAVDHAARAELGRGARPDRADARHARNAISVSGMFGM